MPSKLTRRSVLRASGVTALAALAGCSGDSERDSPAENRTNGTDPTTDETVPSETSTGPEDGMSERAVWAYSLDGEVALGPSLAGGSLYAGRADGRFVSLAPASGEENWTAKTGAGFFNGVGGTGATPTVSDGRVYLAPGAQSGVAGEDFEAVALDADSGEERWSHGVDRVSFLTLLGVRDGHVLAATSDDYLQSGGETLYSLDAASGDSQWTAEVGDPFEWKIGPENAYVAAYQGLRAVSLADGEERWSTDARVESDIALAADTLVLSLRREDTTRLLGLAPDSGDIRWEGPDWRVASLAVSEDDTVYAGGERVGVYDVTTGEEQWSIDGAGLVSEAPVGGRLFVRLDGGIHARNPETGEFIWGTNAAIDGDLALGESLIAYVATSEDPAVPPTLVVRDAVDGSEAFSVTLEDADELAPPVVRSETVYTATRAGRVYAFER